ncbi:MAG TPA: DUF1232 domain-containing protein [Solirubrobacteraceae bacterium]
MPTWAWILLAPVGLYAAAVGALFVAGRRADARALAGFVPDCVLLVRGLLRDPRVPRRSKVALGLLVAYLASPIDLVPDFIPVAGQLDDAILLALVLRGVLRAAGEPVIREHWRGPERSLSVVLALSRR